MRRGRTYFLGAALLLLGVTAIALWPRSYHSADVLALYAGADGRLQAVASDRGCIRAVLTNLSLGEHLAWKTDRWCLEPDDAEDMETELDPQLASVFGGGGFAVGWGQAGVVLPIRDSTFVYLAAPHWAVALALLAFPAWYVVVPLRQHWARRRRGLCLTCGYDLRASGDRCPECGTPVAAGA